MIEKNIEKAEWQKVRCDCCGVVTLAYIHAGKLTIYREEHGKRHTAVIVISGGLTELEPCDITKTIE